MEKKIWVLAALVGISLCPAVLLYLLFGNMNSAGMEWAGSYGARFGGPVAAFIGVLLILWKMYQANPLEPRLRRLEGNWEIESTSSGDGRKALSTTRVELQDGELRVTGGTFFDVDAQGQRGKPIGQWTVEMAVSDGRRIKYFYSLEDRLSAMIWRGLVEMALENDAGQVFSGNWQVLGGQRFHCGEISMRKSC